MSDTESFEQAMTVFRENLTGMYANGHMTKWADIDTSVDLDHLKAAHDREIRDVTKREFHRGFEYGMHSMDAEHRAVVMRLRALPLDGGSHENLSQIARAIYHSDFGWTQGACAALRDELVRLMGGVSDDTCDSQCRGTCADCDGRDSGEQVEVSDGGTAHDCGADSRGGDGGSGVHMAGVTYELREWASDRHCKGMSHTDVLNIGIIADRIDEQFKRVCEQQEAVLQSTIDGMVKEYEHDRLPDQLRIEKLERQRDHWRQEATDIMNRADDMEHERDELQAKLDEYDRTHVELPRDANGECRFVNALRTFESVDPIDIANAAEFVASLNDRDKVDLYVHVQGGVTAYNE